MNPQERRARRNERLGVAAFGYGAAVLLFLLGLFAGASAEAQHYLFEGALICAAVSTGLLLRSFWTRRG